MKKWTSLKPEPLTKKLEIRKRIQEAGEKLYESIEDEDLKWLVGEIMCLNEYWVMENPDTYGAELILSQGFTDNQKKWITNLNKKLKKAKKVQQLLKEIDEEIEKIRKKLEKCDEIAKLQLIAGKYYLLWCKKKIKKAFEGAENEMRILEK